ncbi:MAG: hypothetical protein GZ091_05255 [Paludibacter sp.]|nr:hypothetical protein [Paludibacter sp.]
MLSPSDNKFLKLTFFFFFLFFIGNISYAQNIGDFRSVSTGGWMTLSTWQTYTSTGWVAATNYPGQIAGNYAVTIQAGNTVTIPNTGITTNPMGTLTISGKLTLTGSNSLTTFFLNTPEINVIPNLFTEATIQFINKCTLKLPADAILKVWKENGLSGTCNNNQDLYIGTIKYAACQGAPGTIFIFDELMQAGGTLNAIDTIPPSSCQGNMVSLKGGYTGATGTDIPPVKYNWTSSGPSILTFTPSNTSQNPTITPTVPGLYTISLEVSTMKGTMIYNNTEKATLIVAPTSSVTNTAICLGDSYLFNGTSYSSAGTYSASLTSVTGLGCDSTATLNLTVSDVDSTMNVTICRGDTYIFNGKPYTEEKDSIIALGDSVCTSVLLRLRLKEPSYFSYNDTICLGTPYNFNGNTYSTEGTYIAHLPNKVGCDSTVTLNLKVLAPASLKIDNICSNVLPYSWNGKDYNSSGIYRDTTLNVNSLGCDSIATLELTVNPIPTVTNTSLTQTICSGTSTASVTLTSDVAFTTFAWTASTSTAITGFTTSGTETIPVQTLINPSNSTAGTVTYVITPTANGCAGAAVNYEVTVNPEPISSDIYHQ